MSDISLATMRPGHPAWAEFCARLCGPEGCNFRTDYRGKDVWDCSGQRDRPHARRILRELGFPLEAIEQSLAFFTTHGGLCDCEILFNVDAAEEVE
jgi:hypothetical protein